MISAQSRLVRLLVAIGLVALMMALLLTWALFALWIRPSSTNAPTPAAPTAAALSTATASPQVSLAVNQEPAPQAAPPETAEVPAPPPDLGTPVTWIIDVSFVDEQYGWALGRSPDCATERICPIALSATRDGGETWHALQAPAAFQAGSIVPSGVEYLRFASRTHGWIYGPALFSTNDGGETWIEHPREGDIVTLEAVGRSVWAIERVCSYLDPGDCNLRLLVFSEHNQSWELAMVQPPISGEGAWLVRADRQHAWIVHEAGIATTRDGRASWEALANPCQDTTPWITRLVAYDHNNLWLLCNGAGSDGTMAKGIYISGDGGKQWDIVAATGFPPDTHTLDNLPTEGYPNDLAVPDAEVAFLAILDSGLFGTNDGGRTWYDALTDMEQRDVFDEAGSVWRVLFTDEQHGWAVGNIWGDGTSEPEQVLLRTVDGGNVWQITTHVPLGQ